MTYLPPVPILRPGDFRACCLLLNLARLTQREVGLIQLGSGRVVVRLGGETSFSLNRRFFPATQLYAHTHPNGSLWLSTARDGGRGADTAALFQLQLRNPGVNPWTIVIGNDGRAVTWFRSGNRFGPELEDYLWSFFPIR